MSIVITARGGFYCKPLFQLLLRERLFDLQAFLSWCERRHVQIPKVYENEWLLNKRLNHVDSGSAPLLAEEWLLNDQLATLNKEEWFALLGIAFFLADYEKVYLLGPLEVSGEDLQAVHSDALNGYDVNISHGQGRRLSDASLLLLQKLSPIQDHLTLRQVKKASLQMDRVEISIFVPASSPPYHDDSHAREHIDHHMYIIEANIDDSSAEWHSYFMDRAFAYGANDVFFEALTMKKSRSGVKVSVLCPETKVNKMKELFFKETTTFGVRYYPVAVHRLGRRIIKVDTTWGTVAVKLGYYGNKVVKLAPEYDDCKNIAVRKNIPIMDVYYEAVAKARKGINANEDLPSH